MASYLSYRNVLLNNSTVIASTLNAGSVSYSTLTGSTMSTRAVTVSTLTGSTITISTLSGSTINVSTLSGSTITVSTLSGSTINVSTLSGSTIQGTTVFFSTMTASTILTAGSTINLARNVNVPNRFVEVGCDQANTMYLDFHSSDAALPDYSTRIISQGGATTGTGALNMYTSTIGLMATNGVGIGTTVPSAALHIKNATSAMRITGNLTNSSTRPAASTTPGAFEIRGSGAYDASDDGFLRLSAGGGSATAAQAYIDLSGYSTVSDMFENIVLGTQGVERMRITSGGNVGIGTTNPLGLLSIYSPFTQTGIWPADGVTFMTTNGTAGWSVGKIIGYVYANAGTANGYPGGLAFQTKNPDGASGTLTTKMLIDSNGNVGIGTTNPASSLHIHGSEWTNALLANTPSLVVSNINNANQRLILGTYWGGHYTTSYGAIQSLTSGTANCALTLQPSGGNVGIGITNPGALVHLYGGSISSQLIFQHAGANYWAMGHNSADGAFYLMSSYSSTANMFVRRDNTTTGWQVYSDYRLKENIVSLDGKDMLERIRKIRPVTFNMRCPNNNSKQIGVIAQDVQEIFPNIVSVSNSTVLDVENPLGISITGFIIPLLSAFQQLDNTVKVQNETIISLETQLAAQSEQLTSQASQLTEVLSRLAALESKF